jgi:arginyl-tRNA synthetase
MSIAQKLKNIIETALGNLGISGVNFTLEHPTELSHGDFACNVAMAGAKSLGKNPRMLAEEIVVELKKQDNPEVESIEIAGPGFINFKLAKSFFEQEIPSIVSNGEDFGKVSSHAGQKILVEHSSPNLFKPFHVGHMMNNAIGESLTRLMKFSGAEVRTMSFPSDISLGIAKAIFILQDPSASQSPAYSADGSLGTSPYKGEDSELSISRLGDAYVEGTKRYEEDESIHVRVKEIADNLYAQTPSTEWDMFMACKKFNIEYFEQVVARLGSTFDSYVYESEAGEQGKEIVLKNTPAVFTESEGAIVYIPEESKKHISTSVFINSQGNPTYEAKDIGLLAIKFDREHPDLSLFVTDYQQIPHFDAVLDAAEKINKQWSDNSVHIPHGRMSFKGQKMSSRLGGVPLATEILETILEEVRERSGDRNIDNETMDAIAVGAIKFAILRAKPGQNINFDPETSLSFEGDSGPYLQYTHARITSLLEKGAGLGIIPKYHHDQDVSDVERMVYRLPGIVENAIAEYAPQYVVTYLLQVAQAFNSYYAANTIVDAEHAEVSAHRLAIAQAVQVVLKNGLWLLGIKAPDRM